MKGHIYYCDLSRKLKCVRKFDRYCSVYALSARSSGICVWKHQSQQDFLDKQRHSDSCTLCWRWRIHAQKWTIISVLAMLYIYIFNEPFSHYLLPGVIKLKKQGWRQLVPFGNVSIKSSEREQWRKQLEIGQDRRRSWIWKGEGNLWMHSIMQLLPPTCNAKKV